MIKQKMARVIAAIASLAGAGASAVYAHLPACVQPCAAAVVTPYYYCGTLTYVPPCNPNDKNNPFYRALLTEYDSQCANGQKIQCSLTSKGYPDCCPAKVIPACPIGACS